MTEEQLQVIRDDLALLHQTIATAEYNQPVRQGALIDRCLHIMAFVEKDLGALLAYVDFLQKLIHDLKEESTAYQRGLELGIAAERERSLRACRQVERDNAMIRPLATIGAAECARAIASGQESGTCLRCNGKGYVETEADISSDPHGQRLIVFSEPCPECHNRHAVPA